MAKVDEWLDEKSLEKITKWARDSSLNISDIAKKMKISSSTFRQWRHDYPAIAEAFEEGRKVVDEKVENSFFKMCTGFVQTVVKNYKIRRKEYDERGKVTAEYEEIVQREEDEFVPPSVAAQKFYLCNRMPEKYRPENAVILPKSDNDDENSTGVVMLPEVSDSLCESNAKCKVQNAELSDDGVQEAEIVSC